MRKCIKVILSTVMAASMIFASTACRAAGKQKIDASVLKIKTLRKGYGDDYVKELAEAYEKKTGVKVATPEATAVNTQIDAELKAGGSVNDIDVYFYIGRLGGVLAAGASYVKGWDGLAFEDLSDIMDSVPEGYDTDKKVKEMLNSYAYQGTLYEGKSYGVPYALALEGFVYNEDLMKEFFGEDYHTPRTTDEMFEMFDFIAKGGDENAAKGNYKVKKYEGYNKTYQVYPFIYPGSNDYMKYLFLSFWAQQLGQENYYKLLEGKNADGLYDGVIFASDERYNALETVHDMITVGNLNKVGDAERPIYDGYVHTDARLYNYTDAQTHFLVGEAVFMPTGDWIEREMERHFSDSINIKFMRTPVISSIIDFLPDKTITTDAQLQEVVAYVDNGGTKGFGSYSDADVARVREARLTINCEAETHMMVVPAYSNNIETAKDFIKFVLSKEGQEIQMKHSFGNSVPYDIDYATTYGATYDGLSGFAKSKLGLASNAKLVGLLYNQPIAYKGGMTLVDLTTTPLEVGFGDNTVSKSYKTALEYFTDDYNVVQEKFPTWLSTAGLRN